MPDPSIVDNNLIYPYGGDEMKLEPFVAKYDNLTINLSVDGGKVKVRIGHSALSSHCVELSVQKTSDLYNWLYLALYSLTNQTERKV